MTDLGASLNSLDAIAFQPAVDGQTGDYNNNGTVDAGDYAVFRKLSGTFIGMPNDPIGGMIGPAQYTQWRSNFGKPAGSGVGLDAVPEPTTIVLLLTSMLAPGVRQWKQSRFTTPKRPKARKPFHHLDADNQPRRLSIND